jgi:hypothetical protein
MKSTLVPYKGQILYLAMHGGTFQAKAKADAEPCHPDALSQSSAPEIPKANVGMAQISSSPT